MHKVICEEPRGGQGWARRFPRPQVQFEDAPKQESIKRPHRHQKWFGEHLGPLKRWLRSQVGRLWDDVYAEASQVIKPDNVVRAHIRFHMLEMVERKAYMKNGAVYHLWGTTEHLLEPGQGYSCWPKFYVHPETGVLHQEKHTSNRERALIREADRARDTIRLDKNVLLQQMGGIWYECRFKRLRDGEGVFDLLQRHLVFSYSAGPAGVYACVLKRQLSRAELRRFGLVNRPGMGKRAVFRTHLQMCFEDRPFDGKFSILRLMLRDLRHMTE